MTWPLPVVAIGLVLAACSPVDLSRFSDAVRRVTDRGIGGTGISGDDRGIGGTGIVGTITGFGSVLVNGLTVDFDQETVITNDGVLAIEEAMKVGQVVAIAAVTREGKLQARSIAIENAVSGPITAVAANGNQIEVLGQTVSLEPNSLKTPAPPSLQAGQWVTVSGLRNAQGTIVASRISRRAVGGRISVRGPVTARTATGFTIGRLSVVAPTAAQSVTPGRTTLAVGALTSAGLRAAQVEVAPSAPFDGQVSQLSIEGYVGRREGQQVSISGVQVSVSDNTALRGKADNQLSQNDRVTVDAVLDNGEAIAETIDASDPAARGATDSTRESRQERAARARERSENRGRLSTATGQAASTDVNRSTNKEADSAGSAVSVDRSGATDGPSDVGRDSRDAADGQSNAGGTAASNDGSTAPGDSATSDAGTTGSGATASAGVGATSDGTSNTDTGATSTGVSANDASTSESTIDTAAPSGSTQASNSESAPAGGVSATTGETGTAAPGGSSETSDTQSDPTPSSSKSGGTTGVVGGVVGSGIGGSGVSGERN